MLLNSREKGQMTHQKPPSAILFLHAVTGTPEVSKQKQDYLQALVAGNHLSVEAATMGCKLALACWIYADIL